MTDPFPFDDDLAYRPKAGGLAQRAQTAARGNGAYLDGLNPEQRRAVEAIDGPVLVLAGAGTGKTRVLTTRIAHIIATGSAYPSQILAVTFTNKAAREMKERVATLMPGMKEPPFLGTFHSFCNDVLRRDIHHLGRASTFVILDHGDQLRLVQHQRQYVA